MLKPSSNISPHSSLWDMGINPELMEEKHSEQDVLYIIFNTCYRNPDIFIQTEDQY